MSFHCWALPKQTLGCHGSKAAKMWTANSRTVVLNFRFGSRYRPMTNDDGRGPYNFTDAAYESRVQNKIKALALELLFPFH